MSNSLQDILELCIAALEHGDSIEACLARYPQYADELRPLLQTVARTYEAADFEVPARAMRRGRARVLDHAAELREQGAPRQVTGFSFGRVFNKAFAVLALLLIFALSGTGLVSASSGTLPGDQLYPVKRAWENIRLQLTFDITEKESLKDEFEQERLEEVQALITQGRESEIEFAGLVSGIFPDRLIISGLNVFIDAQTQLPAGLALDRMVEVKGIARADGTVYAQQITVVHSDEGDQGSETSGGGDSNQAESEAQTSEPSETPESRSTPKPESTSGSGSSQSTSEPSETPEPKSEFKLEGLVQRMEQNVWMVNNQKIVVDPTQAEIKGKIVVGASVKIEGYVLSDGTLVAKKVELRNFAPAQTPAPTIDSGSGGGDADHSGSGGGDGTPTDDHGGGGGG